MQLFPLNRSDPRPGDLVVYREMRPQSHLCSVEVFGSAERLETDSYENAHQRAHALGVDRQVDIWFTYRVQSVHPRPQQFKRVATNRP